MANEICPDCECQILEPKDIAARLRRLHDQALDIGRNSERHYRTGTGQKEVRSDVFIRALGSVKMLANELADEVSESCSCRSAVEQSTRDIGDDADDDHGLDDLYDTNEFEKEDAA